jgi:hypothetical protein
MGGSQANIKWSPKSGQGTPAGENVTYNSINHKLICSSTFLPGCTNPPCLSNTALFDTAANITLLADNAPALRANIQTHPKSVLQPKGHKLLTTEDLLLLLHKLPPPARVAHRAPGIAHSLVSAATLADAGCDLFFRRTGCEISLNGEIILQGWRDPTTRLW